MKNEEMREREREWFMGLRGERGRELVFKIFEDEETKGKIEKFDRETLSGFSSWRMVFGHRK